MNMTAKTCNQCHVELPVDEFYTYKCKESVKPYGACKKCHSKNAHLNYVKKVTGFAKLSPEQQDRIKTSLANKVKMKWIAEVENLSYFTLALWVRKSQIK